MNKKIKVIYVFSKYDNINRLKNFINHYKKISAGITHELIICFKLIKPNNIPGYKKIVSNVRFKEFIDKSRFNDFEFMTMKRAVKQYKNSLILFLNSHCYPVKKNWLKILFNSYINKSFIGISGSNESMKTSFKIKKFYKFFYNFKNYFFYKKNFYDFPNPHIRLPAFFLKQNDFLLFMRKKKYKNKKDAWITESGKNSMTNFFKKKNYNIFIVNSDLDKFNLNDMRNSYTFCSGNKRKYLISDRHIDKYNQCNKNDKQKIEKLTWGFN